MSTTPRDGNVLASPASASEAEVHAALKAAREAQRDWDHRPAADLIAADSELLARLISEEVGKPLSQAAGEVAFAEGFLRYNAVWDRRSSRQGTPTVARSVRQPSAYSFIMNCSMPLPTVMWRRPSESNHAHHAGYKESGIGGEDGKWGLLRYTQIKTAYHRYSG